jgi:hypothetical protein
MRSTRLALTVACALAAGTPARAIDRWEAGAGDDTSFATRNELRHGTIQTAHDFEVDTDQDWAVVVVKNRHSYEARVGSGTASWYRFQASQPICPDCATFARVSEDGTTLTAGVADSGSQASGINGTSMSARWIAAADAQEYLRANAGGQLNVSYDLAFFDTTYALPRFNNSGTQVTVLVVQNTTAAPANAQVHFFNGAGTLLHSEPLSLTAHGSAVFNTSTVAALQGVSGSAIVAHTAGYGGLAGKGVALEPATGFTFDTALTPIPY